MNYWSDERQQNGENGPRPFGLRRKFGHTLLSSLCLEQPNPSDSASFDRIFASNAIRSSSVNRPWSICL
jgi:hypothetical protein